MRRLIIRYPLVYHTPLTYQTLNRPPPAALPIILGTGISCPDQKLFYMKVAQNRSTNTNTIPIPSPHPSNIPHTPLSPLRIICPVITPEPVKLPVELCFVRN